VFREGERLRDTLFLLVVAPTPPTAGDQARLGLAVSKKALPRAVDRNRIRRVAREGFRHIQFARPVDVVVSARPAVRAADQAAVNSSFRELLDRASRRLAPR
jgi:ribonuclease P protein component